MGKKIFIISGLPCQELRSIQTNIIHNHEFLLRHSLIYPTAGRTQYFQMNPESHDAIALEILDPNPADPQHTHLSNLLYEISKSNNDILLSSEIFFSCPNQSLSRLRSILSPYGRIHINIFLIRKDKWLISKWINESIYEQEDRPFSEYIRTEAIRHDYVPHLNLLSDIFGLENLTVVPLEFDFNRVHPFIHFVSSCGIGSFHGLRPLMMDGQLSLREVTYLIALFKHLGEFELPRWLPRNFLERSIRQYTLEHGWETQTKPCPMSKSDQDYIRERSEGEYELIARRFLDCQHLFYEAYADPDTNFLNPIPMPVDELLQLNAHLIRDIVKYAENIQMNSSLSETLKHLEEEVQLREGPVEKL